MSKKSCCVICGEPAGSIATNKLFPFCSRRCQLIDLGHWLDGEYRVPGEPVEVDAHIAGRDNNDSGDDEHL